MLHLSAYINVCVHICECVYDVHICHLCMYTCACVCVYMCMHVCDVHMCHMCMYMCSCVWYTCVIGTCTHLCDVHMWHMCMYMGACLCDIHMCHRHMYTCVWCTCVSCAYVPVYMWMTSVAFLHCSSTDIFKAGFHWISSSLIQLL